ncbi:hypothetical protein [Polaribacter sp.]|uniref:hypothetical protein n=1 Tax=Polaribacter sp. TaxID=1920175 RepID=UPI0040471E8E
MKQIAIIILLLNFIKTNSQNRNIQLPNGYGFEIIDNDKSLNPILSIYITKNNEVTFEDIDLPFEKLGDTIFKYFYKQPNHLYLDVKGYIYVDKTASYEKIENLKQKLTKGNLYNIVYLTEASEKIFKGIYYRLHSTSFQKNENIKEDELVVEIPYSSFIEEEIIDNLYSLNFKKVKKLLKNSKYSYVKVIDANKIIIDNKMYSIENRDLIINFLNNKDFILIETNKKITYDTYIKNLSILYEALKNKKSLFPFIEISSDLKSILEKEKITF